MAMFHFHRKPSVEREIARFSRCDNNTAKFLTKHTYVVAWSSLNLNLFSSKKVQVFLMLRRNSENTQLLSPDLHYFSVTLFLDLKFNPLIDAKQLPCLMCACCSPRGGGGGWCRLVPEALTLYQTLFD